METPKKKPRMSHAKREVRRRRIAKAARGGELLASIAILEGMDLGYVGVICRGQGIITPHRAMTVRLACKIIRRRQQGKSYNEVALDLKTTAAYVGQVVEIAEREGVLSGH